MIRTHLKNRLRLQTMLAVVLCLLCAALIVPAAKAETQRSGSTGIQGVIPSPPPTQGAVISVPVNNQVFTAVPVTVSGICPTGLLVKIFKNNVFTGSVQCTNGSFSLTVDLFSGRNELIARVYDALDQAGPDSNTVVVNFNDQRPGMGPRMTITSAYAKRGANPGQTLSWPFVLTGGQGPYAVSIDWGDGKAPDLISRPFPGEFTATHIYNTAGVYNIIVKATDQNKALAFLQVVGIANGPLSQTAGTGADKNSSQAGQVKFKTKVLIWPAVIMIPLIIITFWLGKRHELHHLRKQYEQGGNIS